MLQLKVLKSMGTETIVQISNIRRLNTPKYIELSLASAVLRFCREIN